MLRRILAGHLPRPTRSLGAICLATVVAACGDSSSPANTQPVAVVAQVAGAVRGDTIVLDGTGSYDDDGDSLSFAWSLSTVPPGSAAQVSPMDGVSPAFVADKTGDYLVLLVVNDGRRISAPAGTTVTVSVPAPSVTITTPQDLEIVTVSPVQVSGQVDDTLASVTVNGVPTTVDPATGSYAAMVPLVPGSNPVTVLATNATGVDSAAISVFLNTANAPVVIVAAPKPGFLVGKVYMVGDTPQPEQVQVRGVIRVYTTEVPNIPGVTVDGMPATIGDTSYSGCPTAAPKRCYKFTATVSLARGLHTIEVAGTDVLNGVDTVRVSGASDVAFRPTDAEWTAENKKVGPVAWSGPTPRRATLTQTDAANPRQNNRAHEIDGCSVPVPELDGTWRNDPMHAATQNVASTEFGAGTRPPGEYFLHGRGPARALPCNTHDVCYQTVGSSRATCDTRFYNDMRAVCARAYPTISQPALHPVYTAEQSSCYSWAKKYYDAVHNNGQPKFNTRQTQFTWP